MNIATSSPLPAAPDAADLRVRLYMERAATTGAAWFDHEGRWTAAGVPPETRERFWLCLALYSCGKGRLADAIILAANTDRSSPRFPASHFDIFHTNIAAFLLCRFSAQMSEAVREKLAGLVREGFGLLPGNRALEFQFHGYNDNMPAKAAMGLILGGEHLNNNEAIAHGRWSLKQFAAQLSRRGINSEFNSPTYTPLTLHALAEIAAHARDEESRKLAMDLETRLWFDLASRFHPGIGLVSGPYSRAYSVDALGHVTVLSSLLWFVLGDVARPSPLAIFDPEADLVFHHCGNRAFNVAQMCWMAAGEYHLPLPAARLFLEKPYPFRSVAVAETGDAGPDFPARSIRIETHLEKDFTLGTASSSFLGGEQTAAYFVTYKRNAEVRSLRDTGTVFSKFVINGAVPGTIRFETPDSAQSGEEDLLVSHGGSLAFQSGKTALVLTHPHLSLGGEADTPGTGAAPLSRLEEQVIFPSHFGGAEEIRVGGIGRDAWSGEVPHGAWIACRRGRLLIAIRPMAYSRTLGKPVVHLETINRYECIRVTFYHGESRLFSRSELRHVMGGFVAEHASVDDYASLEDFAAQLEPAKFSDYLWTTRRVRYRRSGLEMEISVSPGCSQPRFATLNRKPVPWPDLAIDGIPSETLPLIHTDSPEVPGFFPWERMTLIGAEAHSAIGDRKAPEAVTLRDTFPH